MPQLSIFFKKKPRIHTIITMRKLFCIHSKP